MCFEILAQRHLENLCYLEAIIWRMCKTGFPQENHYAIIWRFPKCVSWCWNFSNWWLPCWAIWPQLPVRGTIISLYRVVDFSQGFLSHRFPRLTVWKRHCGSFTRALWDASGSPSCVFFWAQPPWILTKSYKIWMVSLWISWDFIRKMAVGRKGYGVHHDPGKFGNHCIMQ